MRSFLLSLICLFSCVIFAQENTTDSYFDVNYFKGYITLHNNDILGLIQGQPEGVILSWNKKTFGNKDWEQRYNYPDYGASLIYQDLKNPVLGNNIGVYGHYNFYFFKRNLMFRVGQGIAYASNPFDRVENPKNIAFGSKLLSSTYVMLQYKKERILNRFGFEAGFSLIHYSNANFKAPNTSINTIALSAGITYNIEEDSPEYFNNLEKEKYKEPFKYNIVFRSGINQSDLIGTAQYPFYVASTYIDKRLNRKSSIQFGADIFFSNFLKEQIRFESTAQLNDGLTGDEDYKRGGIFVGHELFVNKISLVTQLGYYVYNPSGFDGSTYVRAGLKRYFGKKWFGALTLKSHGFSAEALEFGIGVRL